MQNRLPRIGAYLGIILMALLSGCGTSQVVGEGIDAFTDGDFEKVRGIAQSDYDTAMALAVAADDKASIQCLPAAKQCVDAVIGVRELAETGEGGIMTTWQRARNLRQGVARDTPFCGEALHLACAAAWSDSKSFARSILLKFGGL